MEFVCMKAKTKRKENATLLRNGTDIYIKKNRLSLKDGRLLATIEICPSYRFRVTLGAAKQFLKKGGL
ncbi:hypothetical protein LEP1GSC123_0934 [Leptospira borgpetersenii str. 200701203]|uniref:Uncharacterized protein n=1 Tax=Leptospira borgpetersenii str. 200701203 TaxID=1193007 RepID=M3HJE1_LEPBO|nr:hypothetical protein LEP1GSC123_0934 [Leptospira borgpetersenii str. 200701203]